MGAEEEEEEGGVGRRKVVGEEGGGGKTVTEAAEPAWVLWFGTVVVGDKNQVAERGKTEGGGSGGS